GRAAAGAVDLRPAAGGARRRLTFRTSPSRGVCPGFPRPRYRERVGGLFVALGDSFTEGVGDYNPNFPNGVRGWADRVAKQLGKQDPDFRYANLAVRSKRLHQIIADQLEPAIAMQPTLVSFYAGGNDILELKRSMPDLLAEYESAISQLSESGARLI